MRLTRSAQSAKGLSVGLKVIERFVVLQAHVDVAEDCEQFERALGNRAAVVGPWFVELSPCVGQAARLGHAGIRRRSACLAIRVARFHADSEPTRIAGTGRLASDVSSYRAFHRTDTAKGNSALVTLHRVRRSGAGNDHRGSPILAVMKGTNLTEQATGSNNGNWPVDFHAEVTH